MPVRNLPNTAKVWEAVPGEVRYGARASVKRVAVGCYDQFAPFQTATAAAFNP